MSSLERLATKSARGTIQTPLENRRYGEDRLHLLVHDPRRLFVAWEISPALAAAASDTAAAAGAPLRYQVRIVGEERDGAAAPILATVDLPDALGEEGYYISVPATGVPVRALLGLDLPRGFAPLLASRWAPLPPEGPSAETGPPVASPLVAVGGARAPGSPRDVSPSGYLSIVLHAHLPFVRHPEYDDSLEERWLVEALIECYLPLLGMLEGRAARGAPGRVTISLSPTLLAMFEDPLLRERFSRRLERLIELSGRDAARYRDDSRLGPLAAQYKEQFEIARVRYEEQYRRDVAGAFRGLEEAGVARLITCGATHGFLPLMDLGAPSWRAQIGVAVREFERQIGHRPDGMWLPECGYAPGVERVLAEFGIRYFIVDAHAISDARPRPAWGTRAPLLTGAGVFALGRDPESSRQVWSATEGYPGDPHYREYYRDQGFDLPLAEVRDFLPSGGTRTHLGLKYHRITDRGSAHREVYDPDVARERIAEHAAHFVRGREAQARSGSGEPDQPVLLLAPYDAELFGHWWYEGPQWIDHVLDETARSTFLKAVDPLEAITRLPRVSAGQMHLSSWGAGGYSGVWLDPVNDWIYRHLLRAAEIMRGLAQRGDGGDPLRARALRQAGRELVLAQSSDWAFIMKTGTIVPYACRRTEEHLDRFARLADALAFGPLDPAEVAAMEARYGLFPDLEPGLFA